MYIIWPTCYVRDRCVKGTISGLLAMFVNRCVKGISTDLLAMFVNRTELLNHHTNKMQPDNLII